MEKPETESAAEALQPGMDRTLEAVLGFDRVRDLLCGRCQTEYAVRRVMAERFSADENEILTRLRPTDEMRMILLFEDRFPSSGFIDCLDFLQPLQRGNAALDLLSLRKLRTMLDTLQKLFSFFAGVREGVYPSLKRQSRTVRDFPDVRRRIDEILDRSGEIRDKASDELYAIRTDLRAKEGAVMRRMNAILGRARQEGLVEEGAGVTVRGGKMLIPVPAALKYKLPGFIYDESASGKTAFIEPAEIVELDNEVAALRFAEAREIQRILMEFTDGIRPLLDALMDAARYLGETDFLMAKARLSLDFVSGLPTVSHEGRMDLRKARHPLLEQALKREGRSIVPLTVQLSPEKRILLVSGPNAGGKSVCLKTVGLLQYMFQWGLLIPTSEASELMVFDRILAHIGDGQSLDNDLSTYSAFLADMRRMMASADGKTLLLIDEFGSGTEPAAGGALAEAVLAVLEEKGAYGVITTHYTNLKLYASRPESRVQNAAMLFDERSISPLFTLEAGLPGNSFAFSLARKMGLPEAVVRDAEERAGGELVGMERNLRKIARNRRLLDEKLERIRTTDKTLENITGKYRKELEDIDRTRKEILSQAREEAARIVSGANREVENTIRTIREAQAEREATRQARSSLQDFMGALARSKQEGAQEKEDYIAAKLSRLEEREKKRAQRRGASSGWNGDGKGSAGQAGAAVTEEDLHRRREEELQRAPLQVGEKVRLKSNGMVGEVVRVGEKSLTVNIGNISSKLPPDRVERISGAAYRDAMRAARTERPSAFLSATGGEEMARRRLEFRPELDVRGERVADALEKVARYIDDAIVLNVNTVRIIHGKGTGALREEIQRYLRTVPGVREVCDEHIQQGGTGVSVVDFE